MWGRGSAPPGRISGTGTTGASTQTCARGLERRHSCWGLLTYPYSSRRPHRQRTTGPARPGATSSSLHSSSTPALGPRGPGGSNLHTRSFPRALKAAVRLGWNPGSQGWSRQTRGVSEQGEPSGNTSHGPSRQRSSPRAAPAVVCPRYGMPLRESLRFFVFNKACVDSGNRSPPVGRDPGWGKGTAAGPEVWGVDSAPRGPPLAKWRHRVVTCRESPGTRQTLSEVPAGRSSPRTLSPRWQPW